MAKNDDGDTFEFRGLDSIINTARDQTEDDMFYGIETAIGHGELILAQSGKPDREGTVLTYYTLLDMYNELRRRAGMGPYYPDAPSLSKPQDNSPRLGSNKGRGK